MVDPDAGFGPDLPADECYIDPGGPGVEKTPKVCGAGMAEGRPAATREERRLLHGPRRQRHMPDGVDTAMEAVQRTVCGPPLDLGWMDARPQELSTGYDPSLCSSQRGADPPPGPSVVSILGCWCLTAFGPHSGPFVNGVGGPRKDVTFGPGGALGGHSPRMICPAPYRKARPSDWNEVVAVRGWFVTHTLPERGNTRSPPYPTPARYRP